MSVSRTELLRRKTQLRALRRAPLRQLLCRKTQLTSLTCGLQGRSSASLPQLSGKARGLLRSTLLRLKCLLSALRSTFKAGLPHLARGPSLLLQHISLQLLLRYSLAAAAKSSRADGLRSHALLRNLTLTGDVPKRLFDSCSFELVYKICGRPRVESPRCALQRTNALHCGLLPKVARLHEPLLCRGS